MAVNPSIQLGTSGNWAIKEDNLLAYKQLGNKFFDREFDFSRGTTATFVGRNGLIQESAIDVPRIDFTDDPTGHLLLEPQSTNLIPYSEDFSQWSTQGTIITTPSYGISPEGTNDSTRIFFSGASQQIYKNFTSSSGVTGSIYIKGNNGETIKFGVTGGEEIFTLNGDWQRLTTYSSNSTTRLTINTFSGTARDVQVWGAQVEVSSYATSYIPTSGSAVTRNQEICNNSGTVNDFNSEEGVLYAEIAALAEQTLTRYITLSSGASSNRIIIYITDVGVIKFFVGVGGVTQAAKTVSGQTTTNFNKLAVSYKENDIKFYLNGVKVHTDTSASTFPANTLNVLNFAASNGTSSPFFGKTKNVKAFKRALTDAELQELTT